MSAKIINNLGVIEINDQVITSIASISAMESYGIVGLATRNASNGFLVLLGRDNMSKGVVISTEGNKINVDLTVILEYGVKIAIVAENIIDTVKFSIEEKTGLKVDNINIFVQDIRIQ